MLTLSRPALEAQLRLLVYEVQQRLPSRFALVGLVLGQLLGLAFFQLASRSLEQKWVTDYFHYLVLGELTLVIPATLCTAFAYRTREAVLDGTLESVGILPEGVRGAVVRLGLGSTGFAVLQAALILFLAGTFYGFRLSPGSLASLVAAQLLGWAAFSALGLLAAAAFLVFRRGDGAIALGVSACTLFSGAYFPTAVLPEALRGILGTVSPFNALIETTRAAATGATTLPATSSSLPWLGLLAWTIIGLPIAWALLGAAARVAQHRGFNN